MSLEKKQDEHLTRGVCQVTKRRRRSADSCGATICRRLPIGVEKTIGNHHHESFSLLFFFTDGKVFSTDQTDFYFEYRRSFDQIDWN